MKLRITSVLLLVLSLCATASAQERRAESPDDIAARIGTTVVSVARASEGDVGWGEAVAVVDATPEQVLAVITDYGEYHEFIPHFTQSRVLSSRGANALVYMQASVIQDTTTLWANLRVFARAPVGQTQIIEGRMVRGNMDAFAARWEVTPLATGGTLVKFRLLVDPDLPLPDSVLTDENVKAARRTLSALRTRARRQPT